MFYSNFTEKIINYLFEKMQSALCSKGYNVIKSNNNPCSIQILKQGILLSKYEFITDENGNWNCLRCSGREAEREVQSIEKSKICFGRAVAWIDYNSVLGYYDIHIGNDTGLSALDEYSKLCVIHAMMHLICFDSSFVSVDPDENSVAIVYRFLGYSNDFHNTIAEKLLWNKAYDLDTMLCFYTISTFSQETKEQVKRMINAIVCEYRTDQRTLALPKLFQYCGLN